MSASNFDACLAVVLRYEGGFVNHPADPGGATNYGITRAVLAQWRGRAVSAGDVKALHREEAAAIYRKKYWDAARCGELPDGADLLVFDASVNSGAARAARWLAKALAVATEERLGITPALVAAANRRSAAKIVDPFCDARLAFLRGLSTWGTFGRGWGARVADVRASARRMAAEAIAIARPLRAGDRGADVAELQRALSARGILVLDDGIFGPATRAAVMWFQTARGLPADGVVGPATVAKLREA